MEAGANLEVHPSVVGVVVVFVVGVFSTLPHSIITSTNYLSVYVYICWV